MHAGIARKLFVGLLCGSAGLVASCGRDPAPDSSRSSASGAPAAEISPPASDASRQPPSRWFGARFESQRISVILGERGAQSQFAVTEPPTHHAPGSLEVTDLAYDARGDLIYIGTCCEPGSGQVLRVNAKTPAQGFSQDDQGFAIDVAGPHSLFARTDTWGTLVLRAADKQDVREGTGAIDVAVDGSHGKRVIALVDSRRLRALVPTAPAPAGSHDPSLVVREWRAGAWADTFYPLPKDAIYCRVVPLHDGTVGLLAGRWERDDPMQCSGETLDVYDTTNRERRTEVLRFPDRVRHLSIDDSSRFLIFTTVGGAVRWTTLDSEGGSLADSGFVAADW